MPEAPQERSEQPTEHSRFSIPWGNIGKVVLAVMASAAAITYGVGNVKQFSEINDALNSHDEGQRLTDKRLRKIEHQQKRLAGIVGMSLGKDADPDTILGKGLASTSTLPDDQPAPTFKQVINTANSAVFLQVRQKNSEEPYSPTCSGTKIRYNRYVGVLTARHCLDYIVDVDPDEKRKAGNVIAGNRYDYAIGNPATSTNKKVRKVPIAKVIGESVFFRIIKRPVDADMAILSVAPSKVPKGVRAYGDVPALPIDEAKQPKPGEEVITIGSPETVSHKALINKGRSLGQAVFPSKTGRGLTSYNVVGSTTKDARSDSLQFGGSGGGGVTGSGYYYAPLSWGIDSNKELYQPPDQNESSDSLRGDTVSLLMAEETLQLDTLLRYPVLGGYVVRPKNSLQKLFKGLKYPVPASKN